MVNDLRRLKALLTGDENELAARVLQPDRRWLATCLFAAVVSCAVYGLTFGLWRSGQQAVFTAIKFPLVIFLTCAGNGLLNGTLALVMGTGLGFRQSSIAILMSFTITGLILAAFAPIMLFLLWNTPAIDSPDAQTGQSITLLAHVSLIAFAGIMGNRRLWQLLRQLTGSTAQAYKVLFSWLAGNLLLGSQVSWILRPWIGSPVPPGTTFVEVAFFTPHPLHGNFFEAVWHAAVVLIRHSTHQ
ncbi:hypothetical protein BH09VER1_BH09VER1_01660 [soil metagenome]